MGANHQVGGVVAPIFSRSEMMGYPYPYYQYPYTDMEKRQLFLRSYQFSRKKKGFGERMKGSFFRVKRVIWVRLGSVRKIRKMVWVRLRNALSFATRKRRFLPLHNQYSHNTNNNSKNGSSSSSCLW